MIIPTEGLDILTTQTTDLSYNTNLNVNALSFPYLMLRIPELDTNNFGTNNDVDNAFGIVQYDANWISDSASKNRGYLAMIPKFMKCQKVYYPTPLATLQKLTIQIQRPDGNLVSDTLDTLNISSIIFSSQFLGVNLTKTLYADTSGTYIWIRTSSWFSKFMVSQGDRIVFKNIAFSTDYTSSPGSTDFISYIQRSDGHIVVDIGQTYFTGASQTAENTYFATGANALGYANFIILRNRFNDPTTGSTKLAYYGGTSTTNTAFYTSVTNYSSQKNIPMLSGRFINMNHQTQVVLRVITRDMDSASHLRPDNN
jgi:hypothetical protein